MKTASGAQDFSQFPQSRKELMMMWKIKCLGMFNVPLLLSEVEASKEKEDEAKLSL